MGCCCVGHALEKEIDTLPDILSSIGTRFLLQIRHSTPNLDIAAVRAFSAAVRKNNEIPCDEYVRFLNILWKWFLAKPLDAESRPVHLRWLVAFDACVWMLVRPFAAAKRSQESITQESILAKAVQGEIKHILKRADTDTYGDTLRAMVIRWAHDSSTLAKDEALQALTDADFGQHIQNAVQAELALAKCHVRFVSQHDEPGSEEGVKTWWNEGLTADLTLDALIRVSAFQGCMREVIRQHGAKIEAGKPRTAYLRAVIGCVLWSFGSELLEELANLVSLSLANKKITDDKHEPLALDDYAVALLDATVKTLKHWLHGGASDPVVAALIGDVANAVKALDITMVSTAPSPLSAAHSLRPRIRKSVLSDDESSGEESAALARNTDRKSGSAPPPGVDDAQLPCGFVFVEEVALHALRWQKRPASKAEKGWIRKEEPNMVALRRAVAPGGKGRAFVVDFLAESLDVQTPVFVTTAVLRELKEVFRDCDKRADLSVGIEDFFQRWNENDTIAEYFHASRGINSFVGIFQKLHEDGKPSISWQYFQEQLTLDDDDSPASFGPLVFPHHQIYMDTEVLIASGLVTRIELPQVLDEEQDGAGDEALVTSEQAHADLQDAGDLGMDYGEEEEEEAPGKLQRRPLLEYELEQEEEEEEDEEDFKHGDQSEPRNIPLAAQGNVQLKRESPEYSLRHSPQSDERSDGNYEGNLEARRMSRSPRHSPVSSDEQALHVGLGDDRKPTSSPVDVLRSALTDHQQPEITMRGDALKTSHYMSELSVGEIPPSLETTMKELGSGSAYSNQWSALSPGELAGGSHSVLPGGDQRTLQTIAEVDGTGDAQTPARESIEIGKSPGQLPIGISGSAQGMTTTEHTPGESTIHQNMCSPGSESLFGQLQVNQSELRPDGVSSIGKSAVIDEAIKGQITPEMQAAWSEEHKRLHYDHPKGEITLAAPPARTQAKPPSKSGRGPLPPMPRPASNQQDAKASGIPRFPSADPSRVMSRHVAGTIGVGGAEAEVTMAPPEFGYGTINEGIHLLEDIGCLRQQIENLRATLDNGNDAVGACGDAGVWFDYQSAAQTEYAARLGGPRSIPSATHPAAMSSPVLGSPFRSCAPAWNTPNWGFPAEPSFGLAAPHHQALHPQPVQMPMQRVQVPGLVSSSGHRDEHAFASTNDRIHTPGKTSDKTQVECIPRQLHNTPPDLNQPDDGIKAHLRDITRELADCRRQLEAQRVSTAVLTSELQIASAGHVKSRGMSLSEMPQLRDKDSARSTSPLVNLKYLAPLPKLPGSTDAGEVQRQQHVSPPRLAPLPKRPGSTDVGVFQGHQHASPPRWEAHAAGWSTAEKEQPSFNFEETSIRSPILPASSPDYPCPGQYPVFYSPVPAYSPNTNMSRMAESRAARSLSEPRIIDNLRKPGFPKIDRFPPRPPATLQYPEKLKVEMDRMDKRLVGLDARFRELLR